MALDAELLNLKSAGTYRFERDKSEISNEVMTISNLRLVVGFSKMGPFNTVKLVTSTAQFINRFSSILMGYTDRGVLASSLWRGSDIGPVKNGDVVENGFLLWADSYDDQSDADRAAHKAVPVQCALCLAGSIENLIITVNVMI